MAQATKPVQSTAPPGRQQFDADLQWAMALAFVKFDELRKQGVKSAISADGKLAVIGGGK